MGLSFLDELTKIIELRKAVDTEKSYTSTLFESGINRIAQKVGEEAVETIIASKDDNDEAFLNESADLLFHLMVLLSARGYSLEEVTEVLRKRHKK